MTQEQEGLITPNSELSPELKELRVFKETIPVGEAKIGIFLIRSKSTQNLNLYDEVKRVVLVLPGLGESSQKVGEETRLYHEKVLKLVVEGSPDTLFVVIDPPGWGKSEIPESQQAHFLSPSGKAMVLERVALAIKNRIKEEPEKWIILAHSSGAPAAGRLALWGPEFLGNALYIFDGPSGFGPEFLKFQALASEKMAKFPPLFLLVNQLGKKAAAGSFGVSPDNPYFNAYLEKLISQEKLGIHTQEAQLEASSPLSLEELIKTLGERIRFIGGENDQLVNNQKIRELLEKIFGEEKANELIVLIPGAGHVSALTHPSESAQAFKSFLHTHGV